MSKSFTIQVVTGNCDELGRPIKQPVQIPEYWWVAQVGTYFHEEVTFGREKWEDEWDDDEVEIRESRYEVVGWQQVDRHLFDRVHSNRRWDNGHSRSGSALYLLAANEPFGVIREQREDGERVGGLYFVCARQIHKGELGQRPRIVRPKFVRQASHDMPEVSSATGRRIAARDRRRGKQGWACLAEVAALTGMRAQEMVRRYFAFTDADSPALQVIFGSSEQIALQKHQPGQIERLREDALSRLAGHEPAEVWIRQGLALTILYLHHFGYIPDLPSVATTAPQTEELRPEIR